MTNLRKVLHDVRQTTGVDELLCVDHRSVSWCADAADRVDVLQLREAIDDADGARAARLYRGDLLPSATTTGYSASETAYATRGRDRDRRTRGN